MTKPLSPQEALGSYDHLPPEVIDTWNKLILKNRSGRRSVVKQNDAIEALRAAMSSDGDYRQIGYSISRSQIFEKGWLEIEDVFRTAGWDVIYDKPGYNENYEATFTFTPK